VPGLAAFTGVGGVSHAADYRGADAYRGRRVLVVGHSISALEIAAELAMRGAARVLVAARRHRYVLQKLLAGVPIDHRVYTRAAALAAETYPRAATSAALRALIVQTSGHPAQFGAPCASDDPLEAGFTQNQFYLPLVAEGRIVPCAGLVRVDGDVAHLADGRAEAVDAVVCATGYTLDLPFLGPTAREALGPGAVHAALYQHTFHPALPGLALVGVYHQSGPYFPTIELQARWVAYAWSGRVARRRPRPWPPAWRPPGTAGDAAPMLRMHGWALALARAAGVEPDAARWPSLARALLFGPLSPASFRLDGPDALPDAPGRVAEDAAAYGALVGSLAATALGTDERTRLRALAAARGDLALRALAEAGAEGAAAPGGSDGAGTLAPSTPTPLAR
jgi:hypothetical protein